MWEKTIESLITGTITAATWAGIILIINYVRNHMLEQQLKKSFRSIGYNTGVDGWGITLHNRTRVPVRVREVCLLFKEGHSYIPNFSGENAVERKVPLEITSEKSKEVFVSSLRFKEQENERLVDLDFEMSGTWMLSNKTVLEAKSYPFGGYVIIEYPTIFGGKRSLEILFNNERDDLKGFFEHHKKECRENDFMKSRIEKDEDKKNHRTHQND